MSSSLLERTRASHEDIELFERAVAQALLEYPKNHRENVNQEHWVNAFADKIIERSKSLAEIYNDESEERKSEIQNLAGKGPSLFSNFYEQFKGIKEFHRKSFQTHVAERPEAEQMLNSMNVEDIVHFSGEESYGKYLDLHVFFDRFINLKGVNKEVDYVTFLSQFYKFPDREAPRDSTYVEYLSDLLTYLVGLVNRSQPLLGIDEIAATFITDFEKSWEEGSFVPVGYTEEEKERENQPLYDKYSRKLFTNENAYKGYLKGKKHKKMQKWYNTQYKKACELEICINRLASFLEQQVEATLANIERKLARNFDENVADMDEDSDVESESEEEVKMTKENYPVGWDGNPIPFWLYKLHGLGIEYSCEICGNVSYWGRRAFERHFQEWRHAHGMKCLRLENTKEFNEITKIADALELAKKLKEQSERNSWNAELMEECEDRNGNVMNRKTFTDLKVQGLI